jgi:hypothetical protein
MGRDLFTILSSMDNAINNYTDIELERMVDKYGIAGTMEKILGGSFEEGLILEIKEDLDSKT